MLYNNLWQADLNNPFPFEQGYYKHITAMGVIAQGYAPASIIEKIIEKLPNKGLFVFSLNDHTLQDKSFEAMIQYMVTSKKTSLLHNAYGEHLPGINMGANIYVLQKSINQPA